MHFFGAKIDGRSIIVVISIILISTSLRGQVDTGQVLGRVTDQQGAAIADALVTLLNTDNAAALTQHTDSQGAYQFASVKIGHYSLTAEQGGFAKLTQTDILVNIQQNVVVNLSLQPGSVTSTVEVTTAPAQLQTEDASVGSVVVEKTINNLPLNGRNYTFLAQLGPGRHCRPTGQPRSRRDRGILLEWSSPKPE